MKTERLNSWLTLGANVGVLIGLILLVIEIRQNTNMIQAQMSQSRSETARTGLQATYNSEFIPNIMIKVYDNKELTREEDFRYRRYLRSIHRNQENVLWQFNQGLLQDDTPRIIRETVRKQLGYCPYALETWGQTKLDYTEEYSAFVDQAIADLR
ncbi:MAG: hypothetical protein P8L44_04925 [Opitutales bacterium]|jgi:hypothetical protein|nr:hypothetical protein [Opitutales bacterium]MDG2167257.1 hypothetical protein [Opitutales bacterium]